MIESCGIRCAAQLFCRRPECCYDCGGPRHLAYGFSARKSCSDIYKMKRLAIQTRLTIALLFALLLTAFAPQAFGQQPLASATPVVTAPVQSDPAKRQEAFQIVWQTVNDLFTILSLAA